MVHEKVMEWLDDINENRLVIVVYASYTVLFVVFVGVVFCYFGGVKLLYFLCQLLRVVGRLVFVVALFCIGIPIEEALAAFYFKKTFLMNNRAAGKILDDGQWYS